MSNYLRYRTDNADLEQVQDSIEKKFDELDKLAILDGKLLENLSLSTATLDIPHKLGRKYRGYFIADLTAVVLVCRDTASTKDPAVILPLKASGTATAKVWVF
tara:strand:- start:3871 stop:4179 length:309 start_codon:yes stop_codon:yes gene_type:complete